MARGILEFALLGLGAGSVYALCALGIVLVYRGSGVVNFAASGIGLVGAFIFYTQRSSGTPLALCWAAALAFGAIAGAVMHLAVMRPLRRAPGLARLIATLAVFTLLTTWAAVHYGDSPRAVARLLPHRGVTLLGTTVGADRLVLFATGVVLAAVLSAVYRRTKFGLATTAVAESRLTVASQGISPDAIATANWVLGSVLAVTAGILVVDVSGLSVQGLAILVVPALAAALLGGFRSFSLTLVGGLLIGVLESEVSWLQSYLTTHTHQLVNLDGWAESVPFVVIVIVLMVRGRALPIRGDATERAPEVGTGRVRARPVALTVAAAALASLLLSASMLQALTTSAAAALVMLSLVVVTGFAGQLSLAQFALAGFGAWVCAQLVTGVGAPFPLAALAGVAATVPLGLAVGLPSLRARGVNLAVATLGLAVVIQAQVFDRASLTGGVSGLHIGSPRLFGVDIGPLRHPVAYALVSVTVLVALTLMVATVRRGRVGRRLLAVRSNERAAASLGISVFEAKLFAFGLSAAIAAAGGILMLFQQQDAVFLPAFAALQSVFAVVFAVLGGIGFIVGAIIGGLLAPGGFVPELLSHGVRTFRTGTTVELIASAAVLVVLWRMPNGIAEGLTATARRLIAVRARPVAPDGAPLAILEVEPVEPMTLELAGVGVAYGGVVALDGIDLVARPGEIVGLIGPNGAGKTTLIDAITGFTRAHGRVTLNGAPVDSMPPTQRARAGIGRSFQSLELFETMTVRENLRTASEPRDRGSYLLGLVRAGRSPLADAAVAAIREFGLGPDLDARPGELPQGRRRLVAIARAVAARPSVLLLDEPAAGLDDAETTELGHLLRGLARRWGMAIILVEHDVSLVFSTCDRVAVLDQGRLLAQGTPSDVRSDPRVVTAYLGADRQRGDAGRVTST
ncbi:MAG TPA: ATP-binding cassette domain-containing protein, partial [Acidimicrobiales bacterium]|nr:ATP-binding cassette domain-containing protein [Acidimicrobiales bacterium]